MSQMEGSVEIFWLCVHAPEEKKLCAHFGNGQLLDGCKRLYQSLHSEVRLLSVSISTICVLNVFHILEHHQHNNNT